MASKQNKAEKPRSPFGDISKDNPRLLERVSDGAKARATDPLEYVSLTTAYGYRDVTDGGGGGRSRSNAGAGSGASSSSTGTNTSTDTSTGKA